MADITVTTAQVAMILNTFPEWTTAIAGETLAAGQFVYMNATTGRVWKSDASGTGDSTEVLGMALIAARAGEPVSILFKGGVAGFALSGVGYGKKVWLSVTPGLIADAAAVEGGSTVKVVGRCLPLTDADKTKYLFIDIAIG